MILDVIVEDKKKKLKEHKKRISEEKMKELALACERKSISFYEALAKPGLSIIGEFKKASPSMGKIKMTMELTDRIDEYNESVDAISCLTEEDHFLGNTEYFKEIRKISPLPMIRKDFIIDPYQIYEAKVIGADCILLIAAILSDDQMKEYDKLAAKLGMDVLVEIHDEEEMERVLKIHPKIIGVNNRNLKDFTISLENTKKASSDGSRRNGICFRKWCDNKGTYRIFKRVQSGCPVDRRRFYVIGTSKRAGGRLEGFI